MNRRRKIRWWHAVSFAAVLLMAITVGSYAARPSPHGTSSASTSPRPRHPRTLRERRPHGAGALSYTASGVVLPDRKVTPGAVNPYVRQDNIRTTICMSGWTSTIRPDSGYTTSLKVRQLHSGYNYRGDTATGDYEEDHLISLELGGSPTSVRNLWPEPYAAAGGARIKDRIEDKLHELVCAGSVTLRAAQHAIAANWWRAYRRYLAVRVPPRPTARHGCTTTSSGSCIQGGKFCPRADYGTTGHDRSGDAYTCTGDKARPHWES